MNGVSYIIACHEDAEHLRKLVDALTYSGNLFFIHVDQKQNIEPFKELIGNREDVIWIQNRVKAYWGGFSLVKVLMNSLQEALNYQNERIVYLSGLDYPIWSNEQMLAYYRKHPEKQLICGYNLTTSENSLAKNKINHCGFWDIPIQNDKLLNKARNWINKLLEKVPHATHMSIENQKMDIYYGSQWWSLTYDCAKYVYEVYCNQPVYRKYFKWISIPDEMFVQTILAHSSYQEHMAIKDTYDFQELAAIHYLEYIHCIKTMTENDYQDIVASDKMFLRKMRTGISDQLYKLIDEYRSNSFMENRKE